MDHPEQSYVVPGPGALDGLSKVSQSLSNHSPTDAIRWLSERQDEEFARHRIEFSGLWGRRMQLIDVQDDLCEVSKYTRRTGPSVKGSTWPKQNQTEAQ